ncbi:MAG: hypothetical protein AAF290_12750 [Pseudomonadota bacterium]
MNNPQIYNRNTVALLVLSLLPFVWRGLEFYALDAWFPAAFAASAVLVVAFGWWLGGGFRAAVTRVWAICLLIYGLLRVCFVIAVVLGVVPSAHARDAATVGFMLTSIVLCAIGVILFKARRRKRAPSPGT